MKNLQVKNKAVAITHQGQEITFTLRPFVYARMAELAVAFKNGDNILDILPILQAPTPLEIAKIAYCLMLEEDRKKINDTIKVEVNGKEQKDLNAAAKLYFLMSEVSLKEGHINMIAVSHAIHMMILKSLPIEEAGGTKKKKKRMLMIH